jgi:Uma2 family endonuclease
MVVSPTQFYISPEDYLAGEEVSPIKHEYRRGHVYAMVGARKPHGIVVTNLVTILGNHIQDSPCIVLASDTKVRLEAADCYYYPDVVVTCEERDLGTTDEFVRFPKLVIEVLSKSTATFDRGDKFADYQTSPVLEEYVLVSQTEPQVECFRKTDAGWIGQIYGPDETVSFTSVGLSVAIAAIYRKVPGFESLHPS